MRLFILSDLHIDSAEDPLYRGLLSLLKNSKPGDRVVLAGDIFDLYVGNRRIFRERYRDFLGALEEAASRKVLLNYIEGNHDFLLAAGFARISGLELHDQEVAFEIEGKKFFIAHGDTADAADLGYRRLRAFFRGPVMRAFIHAAPGPLLDWIGRSSSRYSRNRRPILPEDLSPAKRDSLRRIYREFAQRKFQEGFDFVVLGHCHDRDEASFAEEGRAGQYMNVGFPRVHRSCVQWNSGAQRMRREAFP